MRVEKTYIIHYPRLCELNWLKEEVYSNFSQSVTGAYPRFQFITIHKMNNGKWFFEFPEIEYGSTIRVGPHIAEIKIGLTPANISELES